MFKIMVNVVYTDFSCIHRVQFHFFIYLDHVSRHAFEILRLGQAVHKKMATDPPRVLSASDDVQQTIERSERIDSKGARSEVTDSRGFPAPSWPQDGAHSRLENSTLKEITGILYLAMMAYYTLIDSICHGIHVSIGTQPLKSA